MKKNLSQTKKPKPSSEPVSATERIQKVLARSGLGSRRGIEKKIESGQIRVNGQIIQLGTSLQHGDKIEMDGQLWQAVNHQANPTRVLIYNKPVGEITTRNDPENRPDVFQRLPKLRGERWISVGRLDINTSGLLLMTTDGELANHLMHPSSNIDREYLCRIHGEVDTEMLKRLRSGVELEDGMAQFSDIVAGETTESHQWYHVALLEGRNREVRRLWASQNVDVSRLKRVRYGPVFMPKGLRVKQYHELSDAELRVLYQDTGYTHEATVQLSLKPLKPKKRKY